MITMMKQSDAVGNIHQWHHFYPKTMVLLNSVINNIAVPLTYKDQEILNGKSKESLRNSMNVIIPFSRIL